MSISNASGLNVSIAVDRVEPRAFAERLHRSFLRIKRRTAEVVVDRNLFNRAIDRRGIKPTLAHQRHLGGQRAQRNVVTTALQLVHDRRNGK